VLVFGTEQSGQQARDSIHNAKFGSTDPAAQQSVQNSISDDPKLPCERQFTRINVAAEEGDHIAGELINHQGVCCGEYEPLLVAYTLVIFLQLFGNLFIPARGFRKPQFFEPSPDGMDGRGVKRYWLEMVAVVPSSFVK
jgi:hypothetical protein